MGKSAGMDVYVGAGMGVFGTNMRCTNMQAYEKEASKIIIKMDCRFIVLLSGMVTIYR